MTLNVEQVRRIAERVTESHGIELVDVEFGGGGKARMLRLFIDKPGGITHGDCSLVSHDVGTVLDVEDAVPGGSYLLEVSSPGLDRRLVKPGDYQRFSGSRVRVTTSEPVEGSRNFEGRLEGLNDDRILLRMVGGSKKRPEPERTVEIELSNVEKARLVPEF